MGRIVLDQVNKSFDGVEVIPPLDLTIEDGEFTVFVGPSGCGKSTLLRLIAGLEDVTGGQIHIDGKDSTQLAPAKRKLAMVFQSYALYPHMSVRNNIAFPLKMAKLGRDKINSKVTAAAEVLNLTDYLERRPGLLSGGQRQRVAIGRAIVREPKAFLFDEPLSNLDAALRVEMRLEIGELHKRLATTMVYVTHDQVEAMTMADRIVVLKAGNVEQVGSPLELYSKPKNVFVAGFIGSPSMLDQRLPPNPLALLTGAADRLVGFFAGGVHHIKRHTRHVGDHDGAVGGFTLNLRGARICMRFWPCVALCQEFGGEFRHNITIFGMDHRDTTQFRQTIEAGKQFIIIHHQGTFIGQKVLERVDTTFFNYTFHLVKHLFAPPCHSHMEGIVAVGTGGFVVPHFQCIMQPLARAGQCEIDDHRCAVA